MWLGGSNYWGILDDAGVYRSADKIYDVERRKLAESINPPYTGGKMGNATGAFEAVAAARGLSVAELNEAIDN
jgi:hypothetical protein